VKNFSDRWASLSCGQSAAVMAVAFLVIVALAAWFAWYFDPLKVEMRAIQRKRRRERKLIEQTRAMLLRRHDCRADRDCFREIRH
jgi:hypothetical protein